MNPYEPVRDPELRAKVVDELLNEKKGWLWSYNVKKLDPEKFPDKLIIEKLFLLGQTEDWGRLKALYDRDVLYSHWIENIVPWHMGHKKQVAMAKFFFDIKYPDRFIKRARKQHLENAINGKY